MGADAIILVFGCWVSSQHFHSPLSPSWRNALIPLHLLPLEWYHLHIWGCCYFSWQAWFQLVIHLAWHFTWCSLRMSEIKGWKYTALSHSFPSLEPVSCSMSCSNCWFLTCKQDSQEKGKVVWYSHCLKNFPQFVLIHTVKSFSIVNEAEVGIFSGIPLLSFWSNKCWLFDLWCLCLFKTQLIHLEFPGSCIAKAQLEGFWA